mgnify:CR=1 FL=1
MCWLKALHRALRQEHPLAVLARIQMHVLKRVARGTRCRSSRIPHVQSAEYESHIAVHFHDLIAGLPLEELPWHPLGDAHPVGLGVRPRASEQRQEQVGESDLSPCVDGQRIYPLGRGVTTPVDLTVDGYESGAVFVSFAVGENFQVWRGR